MSFRSKLRALFGLVVIVYIISPIIFKYSTLVQRSLLFMNHVNTQFNVNLSHPEQLGIKCSRTLRLVNTKDYQLPTETGEKRIELGVWHILPESAIGSCSTNPANNRTSIEDKDAFSDEQPIVLYIHGNGGNRAGDHRGKLYRKLAYEFNYHIVTFDYRGYGDSTYMIPTTGGLTADARFMYDWLLSIKGITNKRIIVWGHSLGTAVAVRMVADLPDKIRPSRLVLEAPFDSIANAIANHPFSIPFRIMPYFENFFVDPIKRSPELNFDSGARIGDIKSTPIMMLHAEDDVILPYKLGVNLFKIATKKLGNSRVKFITIGVQHGVGHKLICTHQETMTKVNEWIVKPVESG